MGRPLKIAAAALLASVAVLAAAGAWAYAQFRGPGANDSEVTVVIARGTGIDGIAAELGRAGVLKSPLVFRTAARWLAKDDTLKAGEFAFPPGISTEGVIALLQSGKTVVRRLTAAEGLTTSEIMALLAATDGLTGNVNPIPPEGSILPETYHFSFGDRRQDVVRRMRDAMRALLANVWDNRAGATPLKTPKEALILASIVEKETAIGEERPRIAAVFLNRLKKGMRLQSDPTVAYGLTGGAGPLGRPLTRADLRKPSPYNTYLIGGLPPTPICNPGSASLEAVLRPAETDDLYFVADGSGGHVFAATLKAHNRNVAKWRKLGRNSEAGR